MTRTLFLILTSVFGLSDSMGQLMTKDHVNEDLEVLQMQLEKFHAGYNRYTYKEQLDDLFDEIRKNQDGMPIIDLYKKVTRITSKIRCGHTRASLPEKQNREFKNTSKFLPFNVHISDDKLYVYRSLDSQLQPGNEIESINGLEVPDMLKAIYQHHSSDGFIISGKRQLTILYFHYYYQLYLANGSESFILSLADPQKEITVTGTTWDEIEKISHTHPRNVTLELTHEDNYSYMKIGTFGSSSLTGNGFDYKGFLAQSFRELKDRKVSNLILDLRGNGGGRDEFGALLVSYLLKDDFNYFDRIEVTANYNGYGNVTRNGDQYLMTSHSGLSLQRKQESSFEGNLFLLTDGWTFSTAADVVSVIDNANRAYIVGEETGGGRFGNTSGSSKTLQLPNSGIRVNLPFWKYTTSLEDEVDDGRGVIPDARIVPTIQQQLNGEDIQLNYCLEIIGRI